MKTFEINKDYTMQRNGLKTQFVFKCIKRTAKTVTMLDEKHQITLRVKTVQGREVCFPFGNYSNCPILTATNK